MRARGFTLLEVMVSLGILAVALTVLSDLNGGVIAMHGYSKKLTVATLLARGKMLDLEEELRKDGFKDFDDEKDGDFEDDGFPDFAWKAEILRPDVQFDAGQLLSLLGGEQGAAGAFGSGGGIAKLLGSAAQNLPQGTGLDAAAISAAMAPLINAQATVFIETIKQAVREVRLTVSWKDGQVEDRFTVTTHMVILPGMVGKTEEAQQQQQQQAPPPQDPFDVQEEEF
jgi:general secretion pathway protein I